MAAPRYEFYFRVVKYCFSLRDKSIGKSILHKQQCKSGK